METLKNYVNWKLAHSDKVANAEGYPLVMENCKANKRMKQLEVYGNCFQSQTPSPDNPSEIETVGDLTTKNLFDMETILPEQGWVKQDDGSYYAAMASTPSRRILWDNTENYTGQLKILYQFKYLKGWSESPVGSFIQIKYTDGTTQNVYLHTSRFDADIWYSPTDSRTITDSSKTVSQIIWSYGTGSNSTWVKDIIITKDINTTEYEPYHKYKIPITARGKNLLPYPYVSTTKTINGVTFTDNGDGSITVNGTATANAVFYLVGSQDNYTLDKCGLKIGDSYTISKTLISGDSMANVYFTANYYNENGSMKAGAYISNTNTETATIQSDFVMWGIYLLVIKDKTVNNTTIKFQIEKGTSATDYEPYVEPITQNIYLDEPLRGALYQSREKQWYYDLIDYKTNKIIRNIAERTFTGATNEKWVYSKETDNKIHFYISGIPNNCSFGTSDDDSIICNLFNGSYLDATQNNDKEGISLALTTNICYIAIFKNRLTDVGLTLDLDGFKTWLSQNPITVTYILKTPIEEDISCQLPKTVAKTTVISADTSLEPSNMKGKYIIK